MAIANHILDLARRRALGMHLGPSAITFKPGRERPLLLVSGEGQPRPGFRFTLRRRLPRPNRRLSPTPRTATMQNRSPITMRSPLNPNRRLPPPGPLPLNAPSPSLPRRSQHRIRWTCAPQARRPPPKRAPAAPQKASSTRTWNCVPPAPSKFPVQIWSRPWRLSRQQSSRSSPTRNRPLHRSRNPCRSRNRPPTCRNQKLLSWMMISRIFRKGWTPPRWKQPARRTKSPAAQHR